MSDTGTGGAGRQAPVNWGSVPTTGPPGWAPPPPGQRPLPGPDLGGPQPPAPWWSGAPGYRPAPPPQWYAPQPRYDPLADPWADPGPPPPKTRSTLTGTRRAAVQVLVGLCALLIVTDGVAAVSQPGSPSHAAARVLSPSDLGPLGTDPLPGGAGPAPTKATPTTAPQPVTPAGFQRFEVPAAHFSIAIPNGWDRQDPSSPSFQAQNQQFDQENGLPGGSADYAFYADDYHHSLVSVQAIPAGRAGPGDLSEAVTSFEGGAKQVGATILSAHRIEINKEPAEQISAHYTGKLPGGGTFGADVTAYVVVEGGYVYAIDETGPNGQLPEIATTFASSVLGTPPPSETQ